MNYKDLMKPYHDDAVKTLQELIRIYSVYDEKTIAPGKPYGEGVYKAMQYVKELALKDGFNVDTCDGHCIEISYGSGKNTIGIFAHLDVVPISGEWLYDPLGAEIHDDRMYGRGTSDDKGPAIASYYALKALKEHNLINDYQIKLVLGGDEERGSSCLQYYFHTLNKPDVTYGFTPDADFPLIFGEKGIRDFEYKGYIDLDPIVSIKAGVAANSVIDKAEVILKDSKLKEYLLKNKNIKCDIEDLDNSIKVTFYGKSAHGSTPEKGINAGIIMLDTLSKVYHIKLFEDLVNNFEDGIGKKMGNYVESKYLGNTTYCVGLIEYENNKFSLIVNFRYPENCDSEAIIKNLQSKTELEINPGEPAPIVYFNPDTNPFIKTLANIYVEETGDTLNKPMTIGGGTYAKECKNTIAFGSHFPGKEDNIHSPNEKIDMEDFFNSMPLYARAIYELGHLEN